MKISKEVKIGALFSVSLVVFFLGYYFLKNSDVFSDESEYVCYYDNINGVVASSVVEVKGLIVGHILSFELDESKKIKVTIQIKKNVKVMQGTKAVVSSNGLLGNSIIRLDLGNGPGLIPPGGSIPTGYEQGVVDNVSGQITPLITGLTQTVIALDTVIAGINVVAGVENRTAITEALRSIKNATASIETIAAELSKESGEMGQVIHNANSITANVARSNDTITKVLSNMNAVTRQLANSPIKKTVDELEQMASQMKSIMGKIDRGDGSMGQLVNDKNLYKNLNTTLNALEKLMADINAHPHKYVNINLIGRKKS